jgi:preprotein translocase subunit SecG
MTILINILLGFYVFVALLMVLVILMQRPKSEGLGAAFGGGVTENIFGAQTTNVLTKITGWLAAIFFLLTFALSILYAHKGNTKSGLSRELMKDQPPVAAIVSPTGSPSPGATAGPSPSATAGPSSSATAGPSPSATAGAASPSPTSAASPGASAQPSSPSSQAPSPTPVSEASPAGSAEPGDTSAPVKRRRRR